MGFRRSIFLAVVSLAGLCACASRPETWVKPDKAAVSQRIETWRSAGNDIPREKDAAASSGEAHDTAAPVPSSSAPRTQIEKRAGETGISPGNQRRRSAGDDIPREEDAATSSGEAHDTATPNQASSARQAQIEEIVVTANRIGIPMWRVQSPTTTIFLVGSIGNVTSDTRWDPTALTATLRAADRVMFPENLNISVGPFALIRYAAEYLPKWHAQSTLPKGQTLADLMPPDQFQCLAALKQRGTLKAGFEREHPFHLSLDLQSAVTGKSKIGKGVRDYVQQTVKQYKLNLVPTASLGKASDYIGGFADSLFGSKPQDHMACLMDAISLAEAGADVYAARIAARSHAWAQSEVAEAMTQTDNVRDNCWPAPYIARMGLDARIQRDVRELLNAPQITVAVIDLRNLAKAGGILDDLAQAGYKVTGPEWKAD